MPCWRAATGWCRRSPAPSWRIVCTGAVAPEALEALGAVREDIPGAGLLHVTSADRLDADWRRRRPRTARAARLLAPLAPDAALVTVLDGHPATLSWLGAVRGHRVGAGRRPLRPVRRPDRPLSRARARRRRHPGCLRRGPAAALKRRLSCARRQAPARGPAATCRHGRVWRGSRPGPARPAAGASPDPGRTPCRTRSGPGAAHR